jgi:hypothetical protein
VDDATTAMVGAVQLQPMNSLLKVPSTNRFQLYDQVRETT